MRLFSLFQIMFASIIMAGITTQASLADESHLIHFWFFDDQLENNTPFEEIPAYYSLPGNGLITFHSALEGYPFNPDHPSWRKASLERRNAPTPLNYRPEGNQNIPFEASNMRGIQVKQPFTAEAGENTLVFHMPSTGFEELVFSFAVIDENAAENLVIDYNTDPSGEAWTTEGLFENIFDLTPFYQLIVIDMSQIEAANNNPHLGIRIRFDGENMEADEGERVTFNNFALEGTAQDGVNFPPELIDNIPFQPLIEAGEILTIDLLTVFSDPENDPLVFEAISSNPNLAAATIENNFLLVNPLQRGDAKVTVSASDGFNNPVTTSFRVLVNPEAVTITADQAFTFNAWNSNAPEYTYPDHMLFLQSDVSDPGLNTSLQYAYFIPHDDYNDDDEGTIGFPYNNTRRTRINGLGTAGISFINTGRDRDLGGALIAVDLSQVEAHEVEVGWTAGTLLENERMYAIRLQYRIGTEGTFADLLHNGLPVEYIRNENGNVTSFSNINLPAETAGEAYVQLLWRYYHISGENGPRPELRLDDITVYQAVSLREKHEQELFIHSRGDKLYLRLEGKHTGRLTIYSLNGMQLYDKNIHINRQEAVSTGLDTGIYLIRLQTENTTHHKKIHLD